MDIRHHDCRRRAKLCGIRRIIRIAKIHLRRDQHVIAHHQPVGFADGDTMGMCVRNCVILDQHILVIQRRASLALIDQLVAHKQRLRPAALPDVQRVVANGDVG